MTDTILFISATGTLPVDDNGDPVLVPATTVSQDVRRAAVRYDTGGRWAMRATDDELVVLAKRYGARLVKARVFANNTTINRAVALLRHRDNFLFDPADGTQLAYEEDGIVARGQATRMVFPRIDPAVIGMVFLAGEDKILLGRNKRNPFYSLIAGYVDPGENLETAFVREVMEETGRRVHNVRYFGSQPWAMGGSLMAAFTAVTEDVDKVGETDGELLDILWASREDLDGLELARPNSIANHMITAWREGRLHP